MSLLGAIYMEVGQLDDSLNLLKQTLDTSQSTLGENHFITLRCMHELANTYLETGELDRAVPLMERTLVLRKAKLGEFHTGTHASMDSLAKMYLQVGSFEEAEILLQELFATQTQIKPKFKHRLTKSIQRLIQLYESWHEAEPDASYDAKAIQWQKKLMNSSIDSLP